MSKLILIQGNCDQDEIHLQDDLTIGRNASNDITLYDHNVSRQHAQIKRQGHQYILQDLTSTNGTIVNGFNIHEKVLAEGDQIQIGKNIFLFESDSTRIFLPTNKSTEIGLVDDKRKKDLDITVEVDTKAIELSNELLSKKQPQDLIKAYRKLAIIFEIGKTLASYTEVVPLLSNILESIFKVLPVELGYIFLSDPYSQEFVPVIYKHREKRKKSKTGITISKKLLHHIQQSKKGVLTTRSHAENGTNKNEEMKDISVMCVPIFIREQLIGVIGVHDCGEKPTFTPDDLELITAIAQQTSLALENIQLTQSKIKGERSIAINEMVSSIAHEIKNPLSSIQIYTELLQQHHDSPEQTDYCHVILKEIQHLLEITNQILDYGQYSTIRLENIDLLVLIKEVVQLLEQQAKAKNIKIQQPDGAEELMFHVDRDKMKQVLFNIILNAIQITPAEGIVVIQTSTHVQKKYIRISIQDSGPGISRETIDQVFKPFYSNRKGGAGLGLAISQRIIEDHQGRITVESEKGKGAIFHIDLPMVKLELPFSIW